MHSTVHHGTRLLQPFRRALCAVPLAALVACGGGGGGGDASGGTGGGGGGGAGTGAASDCFNPVLAQVGTTFRWDWRVVGAAVTGTATFDARVLRTTTFDGVAGLAETEINLRFAVQSGGATIAREETVLDYARVTGPTTLTQYGQIVTVIAPPPGSTTRSAWSPPRADTRGGLASGASVDVAWTTTDVTTPAGGTAQPPSTTARTTRITYLGQESVTVPAGTFRACRFDIVETPGNSRRIEWIGVGSGASIKITSEPGTANEFSYELTGTSRLNGNPL